MLHFFTFVLLSFGHLEHAPKGLSLNFKEEPNLRLMLDITKIAFYASQILHTHNCLISLQILVKVGKSTPCPKFGIIQSK